MNSVEANFAAADADVSLVDPDTTSSTPTAAHDAITLELAKKESAEHLGNAMQDLYKDMRSRPLAVRAYALDGPDSPGMKDNVKVIHFIRHGQGFHNLMADLARAEGRDWVQYSKTKENPYIMPEILDAPLTEKGRQQALILQPVIESFSDQPELIVVSSQCRAIQTAVIAFEHLLDKSVPFIAHEDVRECTGVHTCDKRRPRSNQEKEFPMVDFSLLKSDDDGLFLEERRETKKEVGDRIYNFLEWMSERSETHVGVASHSGWLMTLFNGVVECNEELKPWFQTGELRSIKLEFVRKD